MSLIQDAHASSILVLNISKPCDTLSLMIVGTLLASCSSDQSIIVWSTQTQSKNLHLRDHDHVVECIAFSNSNADATLSGSGASSSEPSPSPPYSTAPVNQYLVSGSRDLSVRIWNVQSGICLMKLLDHDNWVRGVAFHPTGSVLSLYYGCVVATLMIENNPHAGKYVISVGEDRSMRVWDLEAKRCKKTIQVR
jgi:platelet-activating factor acetylhydrolase IB subunit alpha